jgi:glycosyltransferase involved in cell wall biosynthesis
MSLKQVPDSNVKKPEYSEDQALNPLDVHVVILNNYVRKHHVVAFQALAQRVRQLTVLLSVPMEPDRDWDAQWEDLDVRVQKNWMFTTKWKHSSGFKEANFIHIPIDTNSQLKKLNPDIVFSYEMGMRTLFSSWYRRFHRDVPLVMVGNMSDHIESERGLLRRTMRKLIRSGVDYFTYNGPSCKRYFERLSIPAAKQFHVPYCVDPDSIFTGERTESTRSVRRLLYCGAMSERKGILQFTETLRRWCNENSSQQVELAIAGSGELQTKIAENASANLEIEFLGNCDTAALRDAYQFSDICVFPSLADEWGLVPIEAMASGVPVLGSIHAQSIEAVVVDDTNGWSFDPTEADSMMKALKRAMSCSNKTLFEMGITARKSVEHISSETTAEKFCEVITTVLPDQ